MLCKENLRFKATGSSVVLLKEEKKKPKIEQRAPFIYNHPLTPPLMTPSYPMNKYVWVIPSHRTIPFMKGNA